MFKVNNKDTRTTLFAIMFLPKNMKYFFPYTYGLIKFVYVMVPSIVPETAFS